MPLVDDGVGPLAAAASSARLTDVPSGREILMVDLARGVKAAAPAERPAEA
jgi:hypothetical protein